MVAAKRDETKLLSFHMLEITVADLKRHLRLLRLRARGNSISSKLY
jgi:hypothetical protein